MATVSRVHGSNTQVGTLYNPNANLFKIAVKTSAPAAVDLQSEDSYGLNAVVYGVIEAIVDELNPLAWFAPANISGEIYVVMDKSINSASELQIRIRRLGLLLDGTTATGTNGIDISGTVVSAASSFTVS